MSKKIINEDGTEEEVFTAAEMKAKDDLIAAEQEKTKNLSEEIKTAQAKIAEQAGQLSGQRNRFEGEIKKLSDMTEAERAKLSDAEFRAMKASEDLDNLQKSIRTKERDVILNKLIGDDKNLRDAALKHYDLLGSLPEATAEEMARRVAYAVNNARVDLNVAGGPNPLTSALQVAGVPPQFEKPEGKSFAETKQGEALAQTLGLAPKEEPK